jgi:hypothetical protein
MPLQYQTEPAACGDGVGRRVWLRNACHVLWPMRRRVEAIAMLAEAGNRGAAITVTTPVERECESGW